MMWFKKKLKRYVVYSTNHDKIMNDECDRVVIVWAKNDKQMYKLLDHMVPIHPNEFLIFEEIPC